MKHDIIIIGDKNNKIKNNWSILVLIYLLNKLLKENILNKNFKIDDSDHRKIYIPKKKCGGNE